MERGATVAAATSIRSALGFQVRFPLPTVNPKTVLDFGRYLGKSLFYIIGLNPSTRLGVAIGNKTIYFANVILRVGL